MDHTHHDRERGVDVRAKLNHPIIDADGHAVELRLAFPDFLKQVVGAAEIKKWESQINAPTVLQTPPGGWFLAPSGPITIFSSDIGHWDVQNALGVLNEAYELCEDGLLSDGDFKDFTFANSVRLHAGMNPNFFKGTVVEEAAAKIIADDKKSARPAS